MSIQSCSIRILALSLAFLPFASTHAQTPPDLNQADTLGQDLFTASNSTGMVLVVVRGKEVFLKGYGETAPGSGHAPDAKSLLRLCSLSKIFATDLLTKLVADHTVSLDDPLQRYTSPHILVPARANRSITLEDLATHTAGLSREVGVAPHGVAHFTFPGYAYRWHWLPLQHLKTTPGTAALYSNVGFDFLGDALSAAAQKPYAKLFYDRITHPLGMKETGFTPNPTQCARLLQGAKDEGPCTDTQMSGSSAGVYSTGADMVLWLKYLLGTGPIAQDPAAEAVYIDPATLVSQQGLDHAGAPTGIGLGWMHLLPADDPSHLIEKTGGGAGFTTYITLNQTTHSGLFVAFTEGPASPNHFNVFKQSNNLLLTLAGLPLIPPDPPKPVAKPKPRTPQAARRNPTRK